MEKVLRGSDEGVIVYVAPTKALVSQVAAEIYARFSKDLNGRKFLLVLVKGLYRNMSPRHDMMQGVAGPFTPGIIVSTILKIVRSWLRSRRCLPS